MRDIFTFPEISISVVNLNGKDYLGECLDSIKHLNYPSDKIEVIIVDNGSIDGSVEFINSNYPGTRVIQNNKNMGFAFANNQAAKAAKGEYVAFLNNDTRVDKDWLLELLKPIYRDKEVVASGSKVLSMDGKKLDFVGSMINFEGKGFQIDYGVPADKDKYHLYSYLPFVNGGAMMVDCKVFLEAGGFDEDFFAYYEDVDFGWRLWVLGYKVVFAPKSIVYHHHHGTSKEFGEDKLRFLKERNSLYSVFKNYDDRNLAKALSGSLSNIFNRIFVDFKFDYKNYYDLSQLKSEKIDTGNPELSKEPLSSLMAVKDFFDNLPELMEKRKKIQSKRKRDDKALFNYFKGQFLAVSPDPDYQKKQINILQSLGIYKIFEKEIKRTLLIISSEVVSEEMAGPAIRVWNFAKVLSEHMNVILAVPNKVDLPEQAFKMVQFRNDTELRDIIKNVDIILTGGMTFSKYGSIKKSGKYLIIDIYDPYNLATLAEYEGEPIKKRLEIHKSIYYIFNEQLHYGDFFICASERQRDFWLGMLAALNRVNPYSYNEDPTLKKMIDVVPFGLPTNKPIHTKKVLKGKIDGIKKDDFVIIWGGGIYNWFDPLTLIRAMAKIAEIRDDIKLFFMGVKHPNPQVKELKLVNETIDLAKKLNIYNKNVFFNFGWIKYDERQNYLLESDVGIITHPAHIETRFSFRTRILDYLWVGLPIISTEGDYLSEIVEKKGLGIITRDGNIDDIVKAIVKLAGDKKFYKSCVNNIEDISKYYTWEKVCKPLIAFCKDPIPSSYREREGIESIDNDEFKDLSKKNNSHTGKKGVSYLVKRFFYHLFTSGLRQTSKFISNYLKGR
jgi:GT2 family glycosyltransferase/glycosyltransferase involved in cell wall biosynthesis